MTNRSKIFYGSLSGLALSLMALTSHAAQTYLTPIPCEVTDFVITSMTRSDGSGSVALPSTGISATKCVGLVDGNNEGPGLQNPNPNLGYLGDGFLNGGLDSQDVQLIDPYAFITTNSPKQALQDPNNAVDPGWIHLGKVASGTSEMVADKIPFDLSSLVQFSLNSTDGTWSLTTAADIVQQLNSHGIFNRNYFDQLAIVVKQGYKTNQQGEGGGWAVYDFNFADLLAATPGAFDLSKPYSFRGKWNLNEFVGNGHSFSHIDIWARDPASASDVPEPASIALLGLGLFGIGLSRRRKTK